MNPLKDFVGHQYAPGAAPDWYQAFSNNLSALSMTPESFSAVLCGMALLYLVVSRTSRRLAVDTGGGQLIRELERETRMRAFSDTAFELRLRHAGGHRET
ncbi:hypothetical protein Ga0609869_002346 [Rhodovulum iodosum]|uniref:Uncharacterized protein n=1 Tax=Rhodovulum iodosum TaxID=68291 RepID=A0ABV3XV91_9RHOB|nr:hypothetical protein [Rhodovulum robiginosum]RSK35045.1 hypothetical protein EJA01_06500 [Rhodovulum robiginosum]